MEAYRDPYIEPIHAPQLADPTNAERLIVQAGLHVDNVDFIWSEIGYGQAKLKSGAPVPDSLTQDQYRSNCLQRLYVMEQQRPGLAKDLNQKRGLYNFGRIPLRTLLMQDQPQRRYSGRIWAGFALDDWNGAMLDSGSCLDNGHNRMTNSDDIDLAIDEFFTQENLVERLQRRAFEWEHDDNGPPKADVVMFAGHGTRENLLLAELYGSRGGSRHILQKTDIQNGIGKAILGISHPNTVVLVDACSAAKGDDSLCEVIYEETGLYTIGAVADITTQYLHFRGKGGKLQVVPGFFTATEQKNEKYVYHRSPARHFRPPAETRLNSTAA
ncbi:MAG TPA: hypothetical protein VLE73_01395 [Candidatus Saccharimonadales bacterium]|nr:hypothetical protein [Candidatus Saccharimonadales bacterium]